ncbi:MAG: hypothetical protein ABII79_02085 [bacterium]
MRKLIGGCRQVFLPAALLLLLTVDISAGIETDPKSLAASRRRPSSLVTSDIPIVEYTAHNRGEILLAIANNGTFGTLGSPIPDPFTGEAIPSCVYPKGSDVVYLWVAAVWIGAIVGRDTLVSVADEDWYRTREFWPESDFEYRSIDKNMSYYHPEAHSEQDITCEYSDVRTSPTLIEQDPTDGRGHKPLNVRVRQTSMAWSYSYADDFILFDYEVQNVGERELEDVYIGIYVDGDVWHTSRQGPQGWNDDIVGFYRTHPAVEGCDFLDTINIAYTADNDGDPDESGQWDYRSARAAVGVRVVRTPAKDLKYSYNWWITNYTSVTRYFGPRRRPTANDPWRHFGSRMGTPTGDRNKYYVMRHEEFDYDLLFTALDHSSDGWLPPPAEADSLARGWDTRYLLSFGPFNISPGQRLPVSFAWVAGDGLHVNSSGINDLFDPYRPMEYYRALNFTELADNSRWASWVYDNPGVDTDGDDYFGPTRVCCDSISGICDTSFYAGDGIPDFRGAGPPQAPRMRVVPTDDSLVIRWNGFHTETEPDPFFNLVDFEGYRVYIARDSGRASSYSLVASYDRSDYSRYRYVQITGDSAEWVLEEIPFSLDSLRSMFDNDNFDPLYYTRERPFDFEGEVYYFTAQDQNASDLSSIHGIHKAYPDAPKPGTDAGLWRPEDITEEHGIPLPKYYEYGYVITNLLPTVPYYVAVTSFDFGSPASGLPPLESKPMDNAASAYPQATADSVEAYQRDVYVYPNPYRIDAGYRSLGFEGRNDVTLPNDKVRAVHFANLPARCTISIFSLDGDLINVIRHDRDPTDPNSAHDQWNLITRNTQAVVSGLYYWVVESDSRTQIGKLVIIK